MAYDLIIFDCDGVLVDSEPIANRILADRLGSSGSISKRWRGWRVSWSSILRDWLPSSGMQLDTRPCFEYYPRGSSFDPATGVFDRDICIPVVPL